MNPLVRLALASVGAIGVVKAIALSRRGRPETSTGLAVFLLAWPGVIPGYFARRGPAQPLDAARFLGAWTRMAAGLACVLVLAVCSPAIPDLALGLAGTAALLLTIHLGLGDLLPWFLRWAGFGVPLLFDRPWRSRSLAEFWGRRWNLAFIDMDRRLLLRPQCRRLGVRGARFALFALSGVLHELALSFPAGGGWGMPLAFFLLQGTLVLVEERFRIAGRAWTWFWLLAPAPWLFHTPFRHALIVPFYRWLHILIAGHTGSWYLSRAIYAAALGHLLVLAVSVQVPSRLGWKQDIPRLTRFNQKIFWVYASYILLCIVSFAILTWRLHDAFLAGETTARWIAGFIAVFWTTRVLVDVLWYDHRDWPAGNALLAGHALAMSLFASLAAIYWCVALVT